MHKYNIYVSCLCGAGGSCGFAVKKQTNKRKPVSGEQVVNLKYVDFNSVRIRIIIHVCCRLLNAV